MADLGLVGTNLATVPSVAELLGPPWWWNPLNRAIGIKNQDSKGSVPGVASFLNGRVPVDYITIIVSDFGQAGGGVTIF